MSSEITTKLLKDLCKQHQLYNTPSINDKLYLHYHGFTRICNLEEFIGLKALWLEGNALSKIEGLENQKLLRSLFLHENLIEIIEGLENQLELDSLNLSKNSISKIENLSHMTQLTSLNLAYNKLSIKEDIDHVLLIPSLQTLDLQHNRINDIRIVEVFENMVDLRVLYLLGNPVVKEIKHYRKTIISKCKQLKYLDDRPVFEEERRRVTAWAKAFEVSGIEAANEAEREELKQIKREKEEHDQRNFEAFEQMIKEGKEIRLAKESNSENIEVDPILSHGESKCLKQEIENDTFICEAESVINNEVIPAIVSELDIELSIEEVDQIVETESMKKQDQSQVIGPTLNNSNNEIDLTSLD